MNEHVSENRLASSTKPLKLGFLGVGWIGRHRMKAILDTGLAQAVAIADPSAEMAKEAQALAPEAEIVDGLDALLARNLDGVVIATPSARHAEQSIRALQSGVAVFCQKPLGRDANEVRAVIEAAKGADRLLHVDFSYRQTAGLAKLREIIRAGNLGHIFAADLTFHNAYGPDKTWFYDKSLSGGGCLMDLGVHIVDMALWCLDFPPVTSVSSHLMSEGQPLASQPDKVEDYAVATVTLANGTVLRLACSWRLQAGQDAVIEANFFGTNGGVSMRNVNGSFYDFRSERFYGTAREVLAEPPDEWGGRAASAWVSQLFQSGSYDAGCEAILNVTETIDRIYGAALSG